jgi:uncharacterized membrane protein YbhN (UPF0104 family)/GT2 family glycosyltransferase
MFALAFTVAAVIVVVRAVDTETLRRAGSAAVADPWGVAAACAALLAAFTLRALAWRRILPGLPAGQALAGIHLAMGANHVLPFRLGEPLRVASVVRRAGVPLDAATASAVTLRAADILSLVVLGMLASPRVFTSLIGPWGWAVVLVVVAIGAIAVAWLARLATQSQRVRLPDALTLAATAGAWLFEAVVIWRAAGWAGVHLSPIEALVVTAAAVSAQVTAVAPSGFGTYEAAAVAAFGALGHRAGPALAIALVAHALKTAYSLVAGSVAVAVPTPGLLGRVRLPRAREPRPEPAPTASHADGPVVLVLPAHDEETTVAAVIGRAPARCLGREVRVVVVDDGSTDATAREAARAGADVVSLPHNRGLGAAVREGFRHAIAAHDAAVVAFCDADGEYAPEELERLVAPILAGDADYVAGSRFAGTIRRMHPHRRFGNRALTRALRFVAREDISDGQSGYRALSRRAAADAEVIHDYNYAQVLTLDLLGKGYRYAEVPIDYAFRAEGRSFVRLGRYLRSVVPAVYRELTPTATSASRAHRIHHHRRYLHETIRPPRRARRGAADALRSGVRR